MSSGEDNGEMNSSNQGSDATADSQDAGANTDHHENSMTPAIIKWLPFVIPLVPFIVAVLRILHVSRGDRSIRNVLLSTVDIKAVVLSAFLDTFPLLLLAVLILLIAKTPKVDTRAYIWALEVQSVIALLIIVLLPLSADIAIIVGIAGYVAVVSWRRRRAAGGDTKPRGRPFWDREAFRNMLIVPLLLALLTQLEPWLPREVIEQSGQAARIGYVLKSEDGNLLVLFDETTEARRIPRDEVQGRFICSEERPPNWWGRPVYLLLTGVPTTRNPDCPR